MKFAANISWLFKEEPDLLARIKLAAENGFTHIELAWPYAYSVDQFKGSLSANYYKYYIDLSEDVYKNIDG